MSMRSVVEVALQFESFRNIDLFHQGLYHLKTRLYTEDGGHRFLATPHSHFSCTPQPPEERPSGGKAKADHHNLIPAHIIEEQCTFSTRSFLIRYCEEEVELDDVGLLRFELETPEGDVDSPTLTLEVNLMFADLTNHGGADRFGEQPDVDSTEFKSVSSQLYRIHGVDRGLHEYCPVVFDEFHFCVANILIHSTMLDFRLRIHPRELVLLPQDTTGGASVIALETEATRRQLSPAALSFEQWLFQSVDSADPVDVVEGAYQRQVGALAEAYARQAEWFRTVVRKCMTPAHVEALKLPAVAPDLILPEGVVASSSSASSGRALDISRISTGGFRATLVARFGKVPSEAELAKQLQHDVAGVAFQLQTLWHQVLSVMPFTCHAAAALLRTAWEEQLLDQWSVSVRRDTLHSAVGEPEDASLGIQHDCLAQNVVRRAEAKRPPAVEDLSLLPPLEERPVLFEQRYFSNGVSQSTHGYSQLPLHSDTLLPSAPKDYRGVHLFVLVHGFQGNSFDMRLMKNNLALLFPEAIFLCSNSNEDNTEGDFGEMGIRLAQEVVNYMCDWCPGQALGRLSFIAHSIGGLIVRSALPLLTEYSHKMHTVLTLSTPHVGYFLKNTSLFNMGLRVLQSWRQSQCLSQLSMADADDPRETFLYKLSQTKGFELFQNVVLVSCHSDQYSPFDSARVEIGSMCDKHLHKDVYKEMVRNIWQNVEPEKVTRFDINFYLGEQNLDTFIGRAAHIQFLECQAMMKMMIHTCSHLFR